MPNITLFIEDNSPLLVYTSGWAAGPSSDQSLGKYSQDNYMTTKSSSESVTFVFTGLEIQLYGAKRPDYGQYQITVDEEPYRPREASSEQDIFQTVLWDFSWPVTKPRTVKMANMGNDRAIDLDFVTWTFPVGRDDEEAIITTFEDTHSSFKYDTESNWIRNTSSSARFSGGSGHVASSTGSSFEFTFEGDALSLYGPVGPNGGPYTVILDTNGLPEDMSTRKVEFRPNTMLYHKAGLGGGTHKLKLVVGADNAEFAIDYAQVYTAPSLRASSDQSGSDSSLSKGAVGGIVVGGFAALLFVLVLLFLALIRRARNTNRTFHIGFLDKRENPVHPFRYADATPTASPPMTAAGERLLQNQVSFTSMSTSPTAAQLSPNGAPPLTAATMNDSARPISVVLPTTQELIVPLHGFEKPRAPQLQPPPQGLRGRQTPAANGAAGQTVAPVLEETTQLPPPPVYTRDDTTPLTHQTFG